jgi:hypothetical protein
MTEKPAVHSHIQAVLSVWRGVLTLRAHSLVAPDSTLARSYHRALASADDAVVDALNLLADTASLARVNRAEAAAALTLDPETKSLSAEASTLASLSHEAMSVSDAAWPQWKDGAAIGYGALADRIENDVRDANVLFHLWQKQKPE